MGRFKFFNLHLQRYLLIKFLVICYDILETVPEMLKNNLKVFFYLFTCLHLYEFFSSVACFWKQNLGPLKLQIMFNIGLQMKT